jgi:hypothetical protein
MVKFKCLTTGNITSFEQEHDIKTMRTHPEYAEVTEEPKVEEKAVKQPVAKTKE